MALVAQVRSLSAEQEAPAVEKPSMLEKMQAAIRDALHTAGIALTSEAGQNIAASTCANMAGMESRVNVAEVVDKNLQAVTGLDPAILLQAKQAGAVAAGTMAQADHNSVSVQAGAQQQRGTGAFLDA